MTTSNTSPPPARGRLRLRLSDTPPGSQPLDGGWWPQSRDLTTELAQLVDDFPPDRGRIVRVLFSAPDWDDAPKRVPTGRGYVKTGFDPRDDTHVVVLSTSDRQELCLLVVPPDLSRSKGEEALLAAVTPRYANSPAALLKAVLEQPDVDDGDRWNDEGEAWWGSDTAPSYRRAT